MYSKKINHIQGINKRNIKVWTVLLTIALLLSFYYILTHYNFGENNQVEQIPIIKRIMDSNYLKNDFFSNASTNYTPRFHYSLLLAFASKVLPMSIAFFYLTFFFNFLIIFISIVFAFKFFKKSILPTILTTMYITVSTKPQFADVVTILSGELTPHLTAFPFGLIFMYLIYVKRYSLSIIPITIATYLHPTLGIILMLVFVSFLISTRPSIGFWFPIKYFLLYMLTNAPIFLPYVFSQHISDSTFVYLLAYVRHPHHYIPSMFPAYQYIDLFMFSILLFMANSILSKSPVISKGLYRFISSFINFSIPFLVGGYIFTEVLPWKFYITLQIFRLFSFLIFFGNFFLVGAVYALLKKFRVNVFNLLYLVLLFVFLTTSIKLLPLRKIDSLCIHEICLNSEEAQIRNFVRSSTEADSIFITPPLYGRFRLYSDRAIVVDFKSFPFYEPAMSQWKDRFDDTYGITNSLGWDLLKKAELSFKSITDDQLVGISKKYNTHYALLSKTTQTQLPVEFLTTNFKIVKIN